MNAPSIQIRQMRAEDLPAVARLLAESAGAAKWSAEDLEGYFSLVAEVEGERAGVAVARPIVCGESELLNVAVAPAFRRNGIAQALIRQLFLFFPGDWFLEVRESNRVAIELYQSIGFKPVGRRSAYYGDTGEAAIVMGFRA